MGIIEVGDSFDNVEATLAGQWYVSSIFSSKPMLTTASSNMVTPRTVASNLFAISWADIGFFSSSVKTSISAAVRNILDSWNFDTRDMIAKGVIGIGCLHGVYLSV
jgi:hypothetical protein